MAARTNYISVCSGGGGLDLAVRRASGGAARCVLYVERDVQAAAVLAAAMARGALDEAPIWSDLHTFDPGPWRGLVDGVVGGYPCQPFSLAGSRRGADDPRHLWPRIRDIVATLAVQWVFFENVAGHLSLGFCEVADDLRGLGLTVAAGLFQANEEPVRAPHRRARLFILADREGRGRGELRGAPRGAGDSVADPDGRRCSRWGLSEYRGEQSAPRGEFDRRGAVRRLEHAAQPERPQDAGAVGVADAGREGCEGGERAALPRAGRRDEGGATPELRRPYRWPPAPGDTERWAVVLEQRPDLAPALEPGVRGVAHGTTRRVDRLRILGNGVVPDQAEYALRVLARELTTERGDE